MADQIMGEHVVSIAAAGGRFRFTVGDAVYEGWPARISLNAETGDVVQATVQFILARPEND